MGAKKNFVLDTNVILHDYKCIYNFQENDIYIPIVVLEELDKFKKGNDEINYNARQFARELDSISDNDFFKKGASLGEGLGKLFIALPQEPSEKVQKAFIEKIPDHRILAFTDYLSRTDKRHKTILVTKDINLRMKARALDLMSEDYYNDKITNKDIFDKEQEVFEGVDGAIIDRMYSTAAGVPLNTLPFAKDILPNQYFILKSERNSIMARYNPEYETVVKVQKERAFGIEPRNSEQSFAMNALLDDNIKLVCITGKAGTGKTLLALAAALEKHNEYKQILLARPIVALANKDLGYLPGTEKDKISPYMQPLFDNLSVIRNQFGSDSRENNTIVEMQQSGQLVIEALAFIRGRSLSNSYIIVDEAQNLTPHEIKTIITRAGENTKVVFTGDVQQIDQPYLDMLSNGLVYTIDKMRGQDIFAHVNLIKGERSYLSELASNLL
ncbi:MAG: PhoH family protein [Paludibacteraceae bacterium]|jgi:PhoH-like ATPase|nr:PhoH family protein [Paludibacteraceae bacterium]MBQ6767017.1 PhoH family protein [Paludibacteraceae bacterium]MDY6374294.1 PhoH family protein [Bacteroidales bacterium]